MRIHLSSVASARKIAKSLQSLLVSEGGRNHARLGLAQSALAAMLGYDDWAELVSVTEGRPTPSRYDEAVPDQLRDRIRRQAEALARVAGIPIGPAYSVAAQLRATAHPAGPHVDGADVEARGIDHLGQRMGFVRGRFRFLTADPANEAPPPAPGPYRRDPGMADVTLAMALRQAGPGSGLGLVAKVGSKALLACVEGDEKLLDNDDAFPDHAPGEVVFMGSLDEVDLFRARRNLFRHPWTPTTRDGYMAWMATRYEGWGNERAEPLRSLIAAGLLERVSLAYSDVIRKTRAGATRAGELAAGGA